MRVTILQGDARAMLATLPNESVHCCVTSPPYWGLRDYGHPDQMGLESTPEAFVAGMVGVFAEVRRVLRDDGTCWVNMGDAYAKKNLLGIPWRFALALQSDGWYLRSDIIWHKPNPMPENVNSRPSRTHEYLFLLSKSSDYFYDWKAISEKCDNNSGWARQRELGVGHVHIKPPSVVIGNNDPHGGLNRAANSAIRNSRTVWSIATQPSGIEHFATFPEELAARCIKAGCPAGGVVLDPFGGSGTTAEVALKLGRRAVTIELNPEYVKLIRARLNDECPLFAGDAA